MLPLQPRALHRFSEAHDMTSLKTRLGALSTERINSIGRGIEKESLRALLTGGLALTPHPSALGSALTQPRMCACEPRRRVGKSAGVLGTSVVSFGSTGIWIASVA